MEETYQYYNCEARGLNELNDSEVNDNITYNFDNQRVTIKGEDSAQRMFSLVALEMANPKVDFIKQ